MHVGASAVHSYLQLFPLQVLEQTRSEQWDTTEPEIVVRIVSVLLSFTAQYESFWIQHGIHMEEARPTASQKLLSDLSICFLAGKLVVQIKKEL